ASLQRAAEANIRHIIVPGVDEQNLTAVLALTEQSTLLHAALGLHPAFQHSPQAIQQLNVLLDKYAHRIVAIGEIGLDFYHETFNQQQQLSLLRTQLELANQYQLPV